MLLAIGYYYVQNGKCLMIMAMKISSNEKMLTGLRNSGYKFFQMNDMFYNNSFV